MNISASLIGAHYEYGIAISVCSKDVWPFDNGFGCGFMEQEEQCNTIFWCIVGEDYSEHVNSGIPSILKIKHVEAFNRINYDSKNAVNVRYDVSVFIPAINSNQVACAVDIELIGTILEKTLKRYLRG